VGEGKLVDNLNETVILYIARACEPHD